eukprot:NODE_5823_length_962_cov_49.572110_g5240_i0.p1 GENE.NODE_5823_length_962_cov_49.572110_g5240_i0~~NODE_5823_length_962_cov_49.572110_g5240_i0.p1  ORF type:complete len:167 (-),score=29.05 NODE_5823_length_962_cov_49.572110_g5240_i0:54-554(-)
MAMTCSAERRRLKIGTTTLCAQWWESFGLAVPPGSPTMSVIAQCEKGVYPDRLYSKAILTEQQAEIAQQQAMAVQLQEQYWNQYMQYTVDPHTKSTAPPSGDESWGPEQINSYLATYYQYWMTGEGSEKRSSDDLRKFMKGVGIDTSRCRNRADLVTLYMKQLGLA